MAETRLTKSSKEIAKKIPEGATIIKTSSDVKVEEIENGFLITKETRTEFRPKGKEYSDYQYDTKKYYSKEDPLEINVTDKSLADAFEE